MKHKDKVIQNQDPHHQCRCDTVLPNRTILAFLTAAAALFSLFTINPGSMALADTGEPTSQSSTLVNEDFTKSSVSDGRWIVPGQEGTVENGTNSACLTAASQETQKPNAQDESALWYCKHTTQSDNLTGQNPGFLQLTDASGGQTGSVLYNRAIPTTAGLDVSFYQYQFGGSKADGIGFYLTDGSYDLNTTGPTGSGVGGALGYASITKAGSNNGDASQWVPGIPHGVLGVGLDRYGNFGREGYVGVNCPNQPDTGAQHPNSVTLRGAGNGTDGYCLLSTQQLSDTDPQDPQIGTSAPDPSTEGQDKGTLVRIVISPTTSTDPDPTVKVYLNGTLTVEYTMTTALPPHRQIRFHRIHRRQHRRSPDSYRQSEIREWHGRNQSCQDREP